MGWWDDMRWSMRKSFHRRDAKDAEKTFAIPAVIPSIARNLIPIAYQT